MEVHFTPEQEAELSRIAQHEGITVEALVNGAVGRIIERDAAFRAAVQKGIAEADAGLFIEEEEMNAIFDKMLES